jgi:hypothetical protein
MNGEVAEHAGLTGVEGAGTFDGDIPEVDAGKCHGCLWVPVQMCVAWSSIVKPATTTSPLSRSPGGLWLNCIFLGKTAPHAPTGKEYRHHLGGY